VMLAPVLGYLFAWDHIGWSSVFSQEFVMFMLFFVLWSCIIWLIYYALVVSFYTFFKQKSILDMIHDTGTPMIPFLPSMIMMYWLIVVRFSLI
jgi:hypothetical protein